MDTIDGVSLEDAPSDVIPKCPYCQRDLDRIWVKAAGLGIYGQQVILMCPACRSFLGYNQWKR